MLLLVVILAVVRPWDYLFSLFLNLEIRKTLGGQQLLSLACIQSSKLREIQKNQRRGRAVSVYPLTSLPEANAQHLQ